jgi:Tfp pilus assembly protein PilP
MKNKFKSILLIAMMLAMSIFFSCDEAKVNNRSESSQVVTRKIDPPKAAVKPATSQKVSISSPEKVESVQEKDESTESLESKPILISDHYDASGKIDPFKPLIQETPETTDAALEKKPERLLTPLEKIELSQIRLVAVIVTEKKRIAMVEEAGGKGYEVGVGTYIGRRNGIITQIKDSSIVVKEPVRDFNGKLSERIQEIKIHKNDIED